jgi:hypothetical protein
MQINIFLFFLFTNLANAASFEVRDPCKNRIFFSGEKDIESETSVGAFSVQVFDRHQIPYIGSELGMNSILNTPVDQTNIEFPAPKELRVYGWCFELNGAQPTEMPDKVMMKQGDKLVWFYGYGHWKDREWKTYCSPAHEQPLQVYCEKK